MDPDAGAGLDLSASAGPDDILHVLYSKRELPLDCSNCVSLRYARKVSSNWQLSTLSDELLDLMGSSATRALAAGDQGTLDVLSLGSPPGISGLGLYHINFDGIKWGFAQVLPLDTSVSATDLRTLGLARAGDGSLHGVLMTFSINGTRSLIYLSKLPGAAWQSRVVRNFQSTDYIKPFCSIAATSSTLADIAVSGSGILYHLRVSGGTVTEHVLRSTTDTPYAGGIGYSAMSATNGQPLTAAYNLVANTNNGYDWYELWIARLVGNVWQNEKIFGTGKHLSGTSLPDLLDPPQLLYVGGRLLVFSKETGSYPAGITDRQPVSAWEWTGAEWRRSTVTESQTVQSVPGKQIVAAADASGRIHALHFADSSGRFSEFDGGTLMYTTELAGSATSEMLRGISAESLAITVEPSGTVHALAGGDTGFTYLRRASGVWATESVASVRHVDHSRMAMTLDSSGNVHACVYETYQLSGDGFDHLRIRYISNVSGWINEDIGGDLGRVSNSKPACAIRVLADGNIRVAYVDAEGTLIRATRSPTWTKSTVVEQTPDSPRIELSPLIDTGGVVHAAFTQFKRYFGSFIPVGIRYGSNAGGSWTEEIVDDDSQLGISRAWSPLYGSQIALATNNTTHVSYYDQDFSLMRASVKANGAWRNTLVDVTQTAGRFGKPVPAPDGSMRFVYGVEMSASLRMSRPLASPALFVRGGTSFPSTAVGQSASQIVTLVNEGALALTLNAFSIELPRDFAIAATGTSCTTSTVLQPGQSCAVTVKFIPSSTGMRDTRLAIQSDDPVGTLYVKLTGEGQPANTAEAPGSPRSGGGLLPLGDILLMLASGLLAAQRRSAIKHHRISN